MFGWYLDIVDAFPLSAGVVPWLTRFNGPPAPVRRSPFGHNVSDTFLSGQNIKLSRRVREGNVSDTMTNQHKPELIGHLPVHPRPDARQLQGQAEPTHVPPRHRPRQHDHPPTKHYPALVTRNINMRPNTTTHLTNTPRQATDSPRVPAYHPRRGSAPSRTSAPTFIHPSESHAP